MARVTLSPKARNDLDDIWLRIAQDNVSAADRLIDRIVNRCQSLTKHPNLGPARREVAPDARVLVVGDYLALYRIGAAGVQIVRVVHGARQLEGLFDPTPDDV